MDSVNEALYIGIYTFIFVIALSLTIFLFSSLMSYTDRVYEYMHDLSNDGVNISLQADRHLILSSQEVVSYYYNYIKKDRLSENIVDNSVVLSINLNTKNESPIYLERTDLSYKDLMQKLGSNTQYILTVGRNSNENVTYLNIIKATDEELQDGNMKDTLSMIVATIFLVILLLLLPLYNYFERQDDISYNVALKAVTTFVDEVTNNGYIDQTSYDNFINRLGQTANSYDVQVEVQKRLLTNDPNGSGDTYIEQYESYFNKDIFNEETGRTSNIIDRDNSLKNDVFFLDEGDKVYVNVKNTNTTMASSILSIISPGATKQKVNISYGAIVKNNTWKNAEVAQLFQSDILVKVELQDPAEPNVNGNPEYNFSIASNRIFKFKVKILNDDDTNIASKITDNIRLVGELPNCYISPSSITTGSDEGEYIVEFVLDETKSNTYFSNYEYNTFRCFLPANIIQGKFSKNSSANSQNLDIKINSSVTIPEL